jgi:Uma2 family endonuclease
MIAAKDNSPQLTPEEYFIWEEQQLEKHEYIDGQVYAMIGGSVNHSLISVSKNHSLISVQSHYFVCQSPRREWLRNW